LGSGEKQLLQTTEDRAKLVIDLTYIMLEKCNYLFRP